MPPLLQRFSRLFGSHTRASPPSDRWSFGSFSVQSFPGFSYLSGKAPAVYVNAENSAILITVHVLNGKPPPEHATRIVANAEKHAQEIFQASASKYGSSLKLVRERLESGDMLLSSPIQTSEAGVEGHLLHYAVISPHGNLAVLTIEGNGYSEQIGQEATARIRSARFEA